MRESKPVIYGPDGQLLVVEKHNLATTIPEDGEGMTLTWIDTLVRAARMLRDGVSIRQISRELQLDGIPDWILDNAIARVGMPVLEERIATGKEPAESIVTETYEVSPTEVTRDEHGHMVLIEDEEE